MHTNSGGINFFVARTGQLLLTTLIHLSMFKRRVSSMELTETDTEQSKIIEFKEMISSESCIQITSGNPYAKLRTQ